MSSAYKKRVIAEVHLPILASHNLPLSSSTTNIFEKISMLRLNKNEDSESL